MLKEYHDNSPSPSIVLVANVVDLKDDSMINAELVGGDVRLKNSDVLASLHSKLGHLSGEERDSMANLIYEFPELFLMFPRRLMLYNMT